MLETDKIDQTRPDQTCGLNSSHKKDHEKILLVTLYGNFNYGNVLQRFALANILESLGFEVTHLCESDQPAKLTGKQIIKRMAKTFVKRMLALVGIKEFWQRELKTKEQALRWQKAIESFEAEFRPFQDKYVTRRIIQSRDEIMRSKPERWSEYKFAVTGSDQVWHDWSGTHKELEYYYLEFMPPEKRINYAPSFGFEEFMNGHYEFHKKGLAGFERLSSREQEGCDMIKEMTGRDAEFVLDPTLLLNSDMWRNYESKPDFITSGRYVLCYFLDTLPPAHLMTINKLSGGLPVINIISKDNAFEAPGLINCKATPPEFLYLIDNADFVFTNSFHGAAFSINFNKNFLVFKRFRPNGVPAGMFGRIESLLSLFGIRGHEYRRFMSSRPENINYELVKPKLDSMRESSMKYLRECLNV